MLEIDAFGRLTAEALRTSLSTDPSTFAVIATNNETGVEQDIQSLAVAVDGSAALIHLDATQALLTRTLSVNAKSGIDSVSLSAHKIYGPKGVGALVATSRARRTLRPYAHGGGHERGLRSGTLNVPGIVGFGKAAELARKNAAKHREQFARLRSTFLDAIRDELADSYALTIPDEHSSPHILSLRIFDVNSRALLAAVNQDIAFSLGSACATNKTEPSHVLTALGLSRSAIAQTFRISFSSDQAKGDVVSAAQLIATAAQRLRKYALGRSA